MDAAQIVFGLRKQGFFVRRRDDGKVGVSPSDRLTPEIRDQVFLHKEGILAFLIREQKEMAEETRKVAKIFEGAQIPRGVDMVVALMAAKMMASGCPLNITTSNGEQFPIRNLDDYREYAAYSEKTWGKNKTMPLKIR